MKIIKAIKVFLLFCLISFFSFSDTSYSQDGGNSYGSFGKQAKKLLKKARKDYDYGNVKEAIDKYIQLLKSDSTNATYNYELALTYYNSFLQPKAIPYFERAIKYSKDTIGEAFFFLASSYHLANNFDMASKNYQAYIALVAKYGTSLWPEEEGELRNDILNRIEMCESGKKLSQSPVEKITLNGKTRNFQILPAGKSINSDYDDYDGVLSSDDSQMYFTSRRSGTIGGKSDWDDKYFEDIYVSSAGKAGWDTCNGVGEPVNSDKHEAVISISADGTTLYFYRGVKQGTFYFSKKEGNAWTKPEIFGGTDINTKAWETSLFGFTISSNELYVVTDREGGIGGRDIYMAKKQADGSWGGLEDLGTPINSEFDEDAPFITSDGKIMYFSSNGHNSIGGFDIFKSERTGDTWGEPVNLGVPFNTPGDDVYFIVANKSDRAYYSSSAYATDSTRDMDIYMIDLCDDIPATTISGLAIGIPNGSIAVTEKESGKEVGTFAIKDSKYSGTIEHGKNYVFTVKSTGMETEPAEIKVQKMCHIYDIYQEIVFFETGEPAVIKNAFFDIKKQSGGGSYSEFIAKADKSKLQGYYETTVSSHPVMVVMVDTIKNVTTVTDTAGKVTIDTTLAVKTTISFDNVLFDFNKSNIKKALLPELDKAIALIKKDYPNMKFEIAGHTDNVGKDSYNMNLSKKRAKAVADYFASKRIMRSRMKVVGYGATKPVATNDTDDGRSKNRRTEIVIIQ